jgi:hypothetical protein
VTTSRHSVSTKTGKNPGFSQGHASRRIGA